MWPEEALVATSDVGDAVAAIQSLPVAGKGQRDYRSDVLAFVADHPDALHRSCLTGHLTASCWVVDHSGQSGLLLHHSKIQRWIQPGGHADGDSNLVAVALREATEETGIERLRVWSQPIDIDIHMFVNRKQAEPDHLHYDLRFLVVAPEGALATGNHESEQLRWIAEPDLESREFALDRSTIRLAKTGFELARRHI